MRFLSRRLLKSAICSGVTSFPDKSTLTMAWPETPKTSLAMLPILTLAVSSTFWMRFFSAARLLSNFLRRRVRSRSSTRSRCGRKLLEQSVPV